jgi:hypothetical protein
MIDVIEQALNCANHIDEMRYISREIDDEAVQSCFFFYLLSFFMDRSCLFASNHYNVLFRRREQHDFGRSVRSTLSPINIRERVTLHMCIVLSN